MLHGAAASDMQRLQRDGRSKAMEFMEAFVEQQHKLREVEQELSDMRKKYAALLDSDSRLLEEQHRRKSLLDDDALEWQRRYTFAQQHVQKLAANLLESQRENEVLRRRNEVLEARLKDQEAADAFVKSAGSRR